MTAPLPQRDVQLSTGSEVTAGHFINIEPCSIRACELCVRHWVIIQNREETNHEKHIIVTESLEED